MPIGVIVLVAIICVVVAVLTSAQRADEVSLDRERQQFHKAIANHADRILREVESVAASEGATHSIRNEFDHSWVQDRVGLWLQTFFDHDFVFVADSADNLVYALLGRRSVDPRWFNTVRPSLTPILEFVRGRASDSPDGTLRIADSKEPDTSGPRRRAALVQPFLNRAAIVAAVAVGQDRGSDRSNDVPPLVLTVKFIDERAVLYINASIQNGHPFDDFHVLIGLMPALAHPEPERGLAIGLGIGSTTYGMLRDPRLDVVETVELCGGEYDLIEELSEQGRTEFSLMLEDPRYIQRVGDGRKFLLERDDVFDIITVDTLRSTSAFSGSLYSREFYELVDSHLSDDGMVAQWIPAPRVANTAAQVFPYMVAFRVDNYDFGSVFFLGSRTPIVLDRAAMIDRLKAAAPGSFDDEQLGRIEQFVATAPTFCYTDGTVLTGVPSDQENLDLRPRDEYFINNHAATTLAKC